MTDSECAATSSLGQRSRRAVASAPVEYLEEAFGTSTSSSSSARRASPSRSVSFREVVDVQEFTRQLGGGGGVPSDGTWVTLGLGKALGTTQEPIVDDDPEVESKEASYIPMVQRIRLLKQSMGLETFQEERKTEKPTMEKLLRLRTQTVDEDADWENMASDIDQALARAEKLAKEVSEEQRQPRQAQKANGSREARAQQQRVEATNHKPQQPKVSIPQRILTRSDTDQRQTQQDSAQPSVGEVAEVQQAEPHEHPAPSPSQPEQQQQNAQSMQTTIADKPLQQQEQREHQPDDGEQHPCSNARHQDVEEQRGPLRQKQRPQTATGKGTSKGAASRRRESSNTDASVAGCVEMPGRGAVRVLQRKAESSTQGDGGVSAEPPAISEVEETPEQSPKATSRLAVKSRGDEGLGQAAAALLNAGGTYLKQSHRQVMPRASESAPLPEGSR